MAVIQGPRGRLLCACLNHFVGGEAGVRHQHVMPWETEAQRGKWLGQGHTAGESSGWPCSVSSSASAKLLP